MQEIIFIKNYNNYRIGDIASVTNNVAHGFIEKGIASLSRIAKTRIMKAPRDKMMRAEARIEKRKRRTEKIEKIKRREQTYKTK